MNILITGDISTDGINNFDIKNINPKFKKFIKESDLVVYNLEGPISKSEDFAKKNNLQFRESKFFDSFYKLLNSYNTCIKKKPQIKVFSDERILDLLKMNPNTLVTLANNHIKDLGKEGFENTIKTLEENNINYIGAGRNLSECKDFEFNNIVFINVNWIGAKKFNVPFHLYSATKKDFGSNYLSEKKLFERIEEYKKLGKKVVLIIHGGKELPKSKDELGVNFGCLKGLNADLIVVHHPHVYVETCYEEDNIFVIGDFIFKISNVGLSSNRKSAILEIDADFSNLSFKLLKFNVRDNHFY